MHARSGVPGSSAVIAIDVTSSILSVSYLIGFNEIGAGWSVSQEPINSVERQPKPSGSSGMESICSLKGN